jgi:beta-glucanase (GH16 family)
MALFAFAIAAPAGPEAAWTVIWSDEFDGPANAPPDPTKWTFDFGGTGWGNHELETYTKNPENVFIDGEGHLVIRAIRKENGKYTSARLKTSGLFEVEYGKIEARIKIPRGRGLWPAFWMLGSNNHQVRWPACGEIDIMENIGKEPSMVHGTVHGPGYSRERGITAHLALPAGARFSDDFHVFAVEWSPDVVEFFVDGTSYSKVTPASLPSGARWVYDHPFFLLLNVAVGGDWPGKPDATSEFPQSMLVDWVRVSKPAAGQ